MATLLSHLGSISVWCSPRINKSQARYHTVFRTARVLLLVIAALFLAATSTRAQFQQPLVFSSGGAVMVRNDQTGALTPASGSPFPPTGQTLTIDVQGRYLFGIGVDGVHMYEITDSGTGAYAEVPNSPFASSNTNSPTFIAVEPTGNYIAVVSALSQLSGQAGVETFQISPNAPGGPALVPVSGSFRQLDSLVVGASQPAGSVQAFYLYLGPEFPSNANFPTGEELDTVTINAQTGLLGISTQNADSSTARCYASDPQGRYIVTGRGEYGGSLDLVGIDGKFQGANASLPDGEYPAQVWVDSTGTFLYMTYIGELNPPVHIYGLNLQTYTLTETASSPLPGATFVPSYEPDPTGPFNYGGVTGNSISAFTVDPVTGYFLPTANSPFTVPGIGDGLAFSIVSGAQGVSGPSIQLSPAMLSLGTLQIASPSAPQLVTLTSNGAEALSVNSISVSGADASEFVETDTCQAPGILQPNKFCSIIIVFTPSSAGQQTGTLTVTDNAPGSPQSVELSGTGVAPPPPAPVVTIAPNPVIFATIPQGTTSSGMSISVTNSGNATLHISSLLIGGNNSADFTNPPSSCSGAALAAGASCTVSVTFAPLAAGLRSETITLMDDAANSPQIIVVQGSATSAPASAVTIVPNPAAFAATTQGTTSSAMNITVTNSGNATLHISDMVVGGNNAPDFANPASNCSSAALAANATCTISVTFAPLAAGQRSETITLTDGAPSSPQIITVQGNANPAIAVASTSTTTATVTAGATAQYQLQINAGANYSGTVVLACSGAPVGAMCQMPSSILVSSGMAAMLNVSITTTGSASLLPIAPTHPWRLRPWCAPRRELLKLFSLGLIGLLLLLLGRRLAADRICDGAGFVRTSMIVAALLSFAALANIAGCGGGGGTAAVQPAQIVTPPGTSTITITPSAKSASGQPLQLPVIQLTLTVN